jgi:RNA polymerase sigma factor (sigma-70 family)
LLNEYATANSEESFRALVDRHAGMVYHAALRQTNDPHLAEEVTQGVFIALAQKASSISKSVLIGGWLFRATRYAVLNLERADRLRRRREHEAAVMQATSISAERPDPIWERISPLLDGALAELSVKDRDAVITRYFQSKSHKETGRALGVSEDAAKKRLARALEKLKTIFRKRGVVAPTLALATALSASAAKAAPTGLATTVASVALRHAAGGVISSTMIAGSIVSAMSHARLKILSLAVCLMLILFFQLGRLAVHATKSSAPQALAMAEPVAPPPGRIVVWDKQLPVAPAVNVADPTLEQALDREAEAAGGYWTEDFVVYDSAESLQRLLDVLRTGGTLQSGGWTNLCTAPQAVGNVNVVSKNNAASPEAAIPDVANLPPGAGDIVKKGARVLSMTAVLDDDAPGGVGPSPEKQQAVRDAIDRSVKDGLSEGVLEPERLLAAVKLLPKLGSLAGAAPTPESAAQLAGQAHAFWTIIYSLRKSPLMMVSIKLLHRPQAEPETSPMLDDPIVQDLESLGSNRFEFLLAELQAHNQAAQNWLQGGGKAR